MRVNDAAHGDLGMIEDLIVTGANDVWVVSGPYGEVLIPVIDDVVLAVDHDAGSISVRLLPGLLPEEGENA
jgi:16S rRNA processing protein RimM